MSTAFETGGLQVCSLSDVRAHGTVLRDCVVEGLRFIFTPIGVEDDEEPKDRASETRDDQGACRAGREGYPACDAHIRTERWDNSLELTQNTPIPG